MHVVTVAVQVTGNQRQIQIAALEVNRYPDAACHNLTQRVASHLDVTPDSLIFGNGSNEVIDILIRALVSPGENVVFSEQSFIVYALTARVHFECGRSIPPRSDDTHDLEAMAAAVDDNTKLVIVCNPNNPTGTYNTAEEFEDFCDAVRTRRPPNSDVARVHLSHLLPQWANISYRVGGKKLLVDPNTESFTNCPEANALIKREYRSRPRQAASGQEQGESALGRWLWRAAWLTLFALVAIAWIALRTN